MDTYCDVGIAITDAIDKLMRETLKMLPQGHVSLDVLDISMDRHSRDGWVLYYTDQIIWDTENDTPVSNIHTFLTNLLDEGAPGKTVMQNHRDVLSEILYIRLVSDLPDVAVDTRGNAYGNPFQLNYTHGLTFVGDDKQGADTWRRERKRKPRRLRSDGERSERSAARRSTIVATAASTSSGTSRPWPRIPTSTSEVSGSRCEVFRRPISARRSNKP